MTATLENREIIGSPENIDAIVLGSEIDVSDITQIFDNPLGQNGDEVGRVKGYNFTTKAGYGYDAVIAQPYETEHGSAFFGTSAWLTSGTHGHNQHVARHLATRLHENVVIVGPEGGDHSWGVRNADSPITLAGSAAATLSFLTRLQRLESGFDESERVLIGESRGAMVGFGIAALAERFDQDILYSDVTAPCFPRKPEAVDFAKMSRQAIEEPRSAIKLIPGLPPALMIRLLPTLDLHPSAVAHNTAIGRALVSGETGDLARQVGNDEIMHITIYKSDLASMIEQWYTIFRTDTHPNVRIRPLPGSHLTLADPETLAYIEARYRAYRQLEAQGPVDGQEMFNLAHDPNIFIPPASESLGSRFVNFVGRTVMNRIHAA